LAEQGSHPVTRLVPYQIVRRICRYFAGKNQATGVPGPYAYDYSVQETRAEILAARPMAQSACEETPKRSLEHRSGLRVAYGGITQRLLGWPTP
jgi:hypothetical protein